MVKKRLVYLYVSNGSAVGSDNWKFNPDLETQEHFAFNFGTEGFGYLFEKLIELKVIEEILIVIESARSPGSRQFAPGIQILCVPHIEALWPFLRDDDILWARGGWRTWWKFLNDWHEKDRWLLFYRAASNRGAWTFWDIVLDDLRSETALDSTGRFYFPILKPTNPNLFWPMRTKRIYDLCIGASHIHDKKGQWRILPILKHYQRLYGKELACIMPGSFHGGSETRKMINWLPYFLNITVPGMLPRTSMNLIYNQSRLFVHLGGAGQNDRGPLEAMACGTSIMLANPQFHAPDISAAATPFSFNITPEDPLRAAKEINYALGLINDQWRDSVYRYFMDSYRCLEVNDPIIHRFKFLLDGINETPHKDRRLLYDRLTAYNRENAF